MIRVIKPKKIPATLKINGVNQTRIDCNAYRSDEALYISIGKPALKIIEADRKIYGCPKTVKKILLKAQNRKCCYCEKSFIPANLHVEHYRPKTRVKQALGEPFYYPGYYWLIYNWDNLFLGCHACNSSNKGDLFPLDNPPDRVRSHKEKNKLLREIPLLIKPNEYPHIHIGFNIDGQPYPRSPRGKKTIEDLGLLRDELIKDRLEKLIDILSFLSIVELSQAQPENKELAKRSVIATRRIREAKSRRAEFSAMVNDVLSQHFDTIEHLERLEGLLKAVKKKIAG